MSGLPLAYHITVGTYGQRLHGDARGTVDRRANRPGDPIIGGDEEWERLERRLLRFDPVVLLPAQRAAAEALIPAICRRGGWCYHVAAVRQDHLHALITADAEGRAVRRWLKTWLGQALTEHWPRPAGATWWAECGSVKWVWSMDYFEAVYAYIRRQRTRPTV